MKSTSVVPEDLIKNIFVAYDEQHSNEPEPCPFVFYMKNNEIVHTVKIVGCRNLTIDRMGALQSSVRATYAMEADSVIFISTASIQTGELGIFVTYENLDLPQIGAFVPLIGNSFNLDQLIENLNQKSEVKVGGFSSGWL